MIIFTLTIKDPISQNNNENDENFQNLILWDNISNSSNNKTKRRLKRGTTIKYLLENTAEHILNNTVSGYIINYLYKNGPKTMKQIKDEVSPKYNDFRKLSGHLYTGTDEKTIKGTLAANGLFKTIMTKDCQWSNQALWTWETVQKWQVIYERAKEYMQEKIKQINESKDKLAGKNKNKKYKLPCTSNKDIKTPSQKFAKQSEESFIGINSQSLVPNSKINDTKAWSHALNNSEDKIKTSDFSLELASLTAAWAHFKSILDPLSSDKASISQSSDVKHSLNMLSAQMNELNKSIKSFINST